MAPFDLQYEWVHQYQRKTKGNNLKNTYSIIWSNVKWFEKYCDIWINNSSANVHIVREWLTSVLLVDSEQPSKKTHRVSSIYRKDVLAYVLFNPISIFPI